MNIDIICVGTLKEQYWRDAETEYLKRLSRFGKMTITQGRESRAPTKAGPAEENQIIMEEGRAILNAIPKQSCVIALDMRGKTFSSEGFAEKIETLCTGGVSRAAFLIGGSLGLSGEVKDSANLCLSFSTMTFPHQMIRIVLEEQLYRAFKIINGEAYHK